MEDAAPLRPRRRRYAAALAIGLVCVAWIAAWGWLARPQGNHFHLSWQRYVKGYRNLATTEDGDCFILSEYDEQQLVALDSSGKRLWEWRRKETPPRYGEVFALDEGVLLLTRPFDAVLLSYSGDLMWETSVLSWRSHPEPRKGVDARYVISSHNDWIGLNRKGKVVWRWPHEEYGYPFSTDNPVDPIRTLSIGPPPWSKEHKNYSGPQLALSARDGLPIDQERAEQKVSLPGRYEIRAMVNNGEDLWLAGQNGIWRIDSSGQIRWLAHVQHTIPYGKERAILVGETLVYQIGAACQIITPDGEVGSNLQLPDDICGLAAWRGKVLVGTLRQSQSRLSSLLQLDEDPRLILSCFDLQGGKLWEETTGLALPEAPAQFTCAGDMLYVVEMYQSDDYYSSYAKLFALELRP